MPHRKEQPSQGESESRRRGRRIKATEEAEQPASSEVPEGMIDLYEAAAMLGIELHTLRRRAKRLGVSMEVRRVPTVTTVEKTFIPREALEQLDERLPTGPRPRGR